MTYQEYESHVSGLSDEELNKEFQAVKELRKSAYSNIESEGYTFDTRPKVKGFKLVVETNRKIDIILTQMGRNIFKPNYKSLPIKK